MRIALVTDGVFPFAVGGMQGHSANLARHLASQGAEVTLYYPRPDPASRVASGFDDIEMVPVPWPKLGRFPGHYLLELWLYSQRVRALVAAGSADWIYVQGLCGMGLLRNKAGLAPIALNMHGLEMYQKSPSARASMAQVLLRPAAGYSLRHADLVFSLGRGLTRIIAALGVPSDRIVEIPVGIDRDWIAAGASSAHSPRRFVFIGRAERRKGIEELNEAVRRLMPHASFEIDFVGPVAKDRRLAIPGVRYHGLLTDRHAVRNVLAQADVLVCPSYAEGMPTVILEAMAVGLAVIATDVGAVGELVSEANGWLINPGDVKSLTAGMTAALTASDADLLRMKEASLGRLGGRFTWEGVAAATLEAFHSASDSKLGV